MRGWNKRQVLKVTTREVPNKDRFLKSGVVLFFIVKVREVPIHLRISVVSFGFYGRFVPVFIWFYHGI